MTYAIGNVVYGHDLTGIEFPEEISEIVEYDYFENGEPGFLQWYSGSGEMPYAFGVGIPDYCFDECSGFLLRHLTKPIQDEKMHEGIYRRYLGSIENEKVKDYIKSLGKPDYRVVWSTS